MDHMKFMREAISLAEANVRSGKGGPFGAVVVKDGKIIARGTNRVTETCDPTAHAEVVAIRQACEVLGTFQLTDCDVYSSCEPCPMCLGALYWARPRRVYFGASHAQAAEAGFDDSFIYRELSLPVEIRTLPMEHLNAQECWNPFQAWIDKEDKTPY